MADSSTTPAMERPSDDVVEKVYIEVLEQLALPAAAAQKLIANETIEKKWQTIQMNASLLSNETMQAIRSWSGADADFLRQFDSMENPDLDTIRSLKSRVSTANKDWLQGFQRAGGVVAILRALRKRLSHVPRSDLDHGVLMELCETLKATMNTHDGLEHVAATEGSIEVLALCLDFSCPPLARLVLEILAVTCYFSRADLVKVGLEILHRRQGLAPYELLTEALKDADVAVKSGIMIFLNSFITSTQNLDDRIAIRHYLLSRDVTGICEAVIEEFDAEKEVELYQAMVDDAPSSLNTTLHGPGGAHVPSVSSSGGGSHLSVGSHHGRTLSFERTTSRIVERQSSALRLPEGLQKAEDGKTPIFPDRGIMAGKGITAKNKQKQAKQLVSSLLNISRVKMRWYVLDGKTLSWTKYSTGAEQEAAEPGEDAADHLPMAKVLDIRPISTDPDLLKFPYSFDVVTELRTFSIAVDSEELRIKWIAALKYAKEKARAQAGGPSMTKLRSTDILDPRVVRDKFEMFKKQTAIFHAVMAADTESTIKEVLGGMNAADPEAVFRFLQEELDKAGLGDQLLKLLHQLLLLPTDYTLGRDTWEVLQQVVYELRNFDRSRRNNVDGWLAPIEEFQSLVLARREIDARIRRARAAETTAANNNMQSKDQEVIRALEEEVRDLRARLTAVPRRSISEHTHRPITEHFPLPPSPHHPPATPHGAPNVPPTPSPFLQSASFSVSALGSTMGSTLGATQMAGTTNLNAHDNPPTFRPPPPPGPPPSASLRSTGHNHTMGAHATSAVLAATHGKTKTEPEEAGSEGNAPPSSATSRPVHPLAMALAAKTKAGTTTLAQDDSSKAPEHTTTAAPEDTTPPPSEEAAEPAPPRPAHPLAAMLAARQAQQAGPPPEGAAPPRPPMHPLAMALKAKQAAGPPAEGDEAPPARPVHPLAAALAGAGGGGGPRPAHPLAMALKGIGGPRGPMGPLGGAPGGGGGGEEGQAGPKTPEQLGLPPKPKVEPPQKMKGLFWSPLPPVKVTATVWSNLRDFKDFDVASLLEDFAAKQEAPAPKAKPSQGDKRAAVTLFDGKRNQNVLIALGRFKMTPEQLRDVTLALQESFLNVENTQKLLNILPTAEEVSAVHAYDGDLSTLGQVEQFFHAISAVPRVELRLKCWQTTLTLDDSMAVLRDKISLMQRGATAVKGCKGFLKVLEVTLAVGNYMNGTSARGGAYGFRLDVLSKLNDVKAGSRFKGTLLNFIAGQADAKVPECRHMVKDLAPVHDAAEHSLGQVENDIKALQVALTLAKKEAEEMDGLPDDAAKPFKTKIGRFLTRVEKPFAELNASLEQLKAQLNEVMASFGEDLGKLSDQDPAQKFFQTISNFTNGYRDALENNRKMAAEAAKLAAKQGGDDKKAADANNKAKQQGADQNIFNSFSNAQNQKSADQIVAEFREKMMARRQHVAVPQNTTGSLPPESDW